MLQDVLNHMYSVIISLYILLHTFIHLIRGFQSPYFLVKENLCTAQLHLKNNGIPYVLL